MSLPPPGINQAFCDVSALEAGYVTAPLACFLTDVGDDEFFTVPTLSFLVRHHANDDTVIFDLGLRKEWKKLPPGLVSYFTEQLHFQLNIKQDVVDSLAQGGTKPSDIKRVFISHLHFDHFGDAALFPTSQFFVGEGGRALVADGYPKNPSSFLPIDLLNALPKERTRFLDVASAPALGPFPHALDFYGDGSLYIVDAPGHLPGHINVLARTSADGGWIYLAADSVHDWRIMTGEGKISTEPFCIHANKAQAEVTIERIREVNKIPRVRVLLAHDRPWYDLNKGGDAYWPGEIKSL
ncbi:Metallo-hydrolase/oxidoreductase [Dichomitus squalens LYAD-421 SS1]|uniref:Metallo-hydrolase/oxidoreductase n=1 Tax=Dichomitus squalens (strain LYAD-421) TaxID=732165 RepID=R7SI21_DICSQ|nr:Metallo-hydrolase/oxidoreductase [Dichomitus squalens LYAD-421 SS1]EJF55789.1 Metallo-hydrolase/oxidoreductase [Dichomitus squalens LYAD-421 SS1]